jgi:hypothetical protein
MSQNEYRGVFDGAILGMYLVLQCLAILFLGLGLAQEESVDQVGQTTIYRASDQLYYLVGGMLALHVVLVLMGVYLRRWLVTAVLFAFLGFLTLMWTDMRGSYIRVSPDGFANVRRPFLRDQDCDVRFDEVKRIRVGTEIERTTAGAERRHVTAVLGDGEERTAGHMPVAAVEQIGELARKRGIPVE